MIDLHCTGSATLMLGVASTVALGGCVASDRYPRRDRTHSELRQLSQIVVAVHQQARDVGTIRSVAELLECAHRERFLPELQYADGDLEEDAWDNPYVWQSTTEPTGTVATILSSGRNGVLEDGAGDDVYVRIEIHEAGPPKITLKLSP